MVLPLNSHSTSFSAVYRATAQHLAGLPLETVTHQGIKLFNVPKDKKERSIFERISSIFTSKKFEISSPNLMNTSYKSLFDLYNKLDSEINAIEKLKVKHLLSNENSYKKIERFNGKIDHLQDNLRYLQKSITDEMQLRNQLLHNIIQPIYPKNLDQQCEFLQICKSSELLTREFNSVFSQIKLKSGGTVAATVDDGEKLKEQKLYLDIPSFYGTLAEKINKGEIKFEDLKPLSKQANFDKYNKIDITLHVRRDEKRTKALKIFGISALIASAPLLVVVGAAAAVAALTLGAGFVLVYGLMQAAVDPYASRR